MSGPPIRIALVGLGKIARDQHLAAIRDNGAFVLAATVSPDTTGMDAVAHFPDFASLLAEGPPFDGIALCTPPQVRFELAACAIAAGKHVLLEKPPGATPSEVLSLEEMARAAGVSLFTAWHSRFAGGVGPARDWLAGRTIIEVDIVWREDVRVWHPGQSWIWRPGGLGVFDPGINALSILTAILPGPWRLAEAQLEVPENVVMPIAAALRLEGEAGFPVRVDLDFRQTGAQSWDIVVTTSAGVMRLANGGADLSLPTEHRHFEDREYAGIYARFHDLIRAGGRDVDVRPLQLVADAFLLANRQVVAAFHDG